MRKRIATTLAGGMIAGLATLAIAGTAHAEGTYAGDFPSESECNFAGIGKTTDSLASYGAYNCVPNGGGPSDTKSWSLYVY